METLSYKKIPYQNELIRNFNVKISFSLVYRADNIMFSNNVVFAIF